VLGYAYTDPQLGGSMTLKEAQKQSINARAVTMPMAHIARAIGGHDLGFYRMVVDNTDKILGATLATKPPN